MTTLRTDLRNTRESARRIRFEPVSPLTETNVQKAIEQGFVVAASIVSTSVTAGMSPYTVGESDRVLYVNTSAGPVQILLAPGVSRSSSLTIKDISGNAETNNITITPSGAETVDGLAPLIVNAAFGGYALNPRPTGYTVAP